MSGEIEAVIRTRQTASEVVAEVLKDCKDLSEVELRDRILAGVVGHPELYPSGWYDPPAGGVSVLFGDAPFERLQFNSLRNPVFFPNQSHVFGPETVGIIYLSPVDRASGMIGDTSFTIYNGSDEKVQNHIRTVFETVIGLAEHAEVGMKFSELYAFAMDLFQKNNKAIGWMTTTHDPLKINLGHTVPGSYGGTVANAFEERKEEIRSQRLYINQVEEFVIPETCAFTVEARLIDTTDVSMPNAICHVITTFSEGERKILTNFDPIFKSIGMLEYML
jgi:hypothetical protein